MAVDESALSELLDAFRAGDGLDVVREAVRMVFQELIETEFADVIGAARYERTEERVTHRNGSRPRLLSTKAGDVALRIPKLREGTFFPSLLEPRRRIDQALWAVVMEAFVTGTSTRKVDDLVQALGVESGISKSEVSRGAGCISPATCWPASPKAPRTWSPPRCGPCSSTPTPSSSPPPGTTWLTRSTPSSRK